METRENVIWLEDGQATPEVDFGSRRFSRMWFKAQTERIPLFVIVKNRNYCTVDYDMYTTAFDLSKEAYKAIEGLFEQCPDNTLKHKSSWYANARHGHSPGLRLVDCRQLAEATKAILLDKTCWVDWVTGVPYEEWAKLSGDERAERYNEYLSLPRRFNQKEVLKGFL